jgi:hypothetical protein
MGRELQDAPQRRDPDGRQEMRKGGRAENRRTRGRGVEAGRRSCTEIPLQSTIKPTGAYEVEPRVGDSDQSPTHTVRLRWMTSTRAPTLARPSRSRLLTLSRKRS